MIKLTANTRALSVKVTPKYRADMHPTRRNSSHGVMFWFKCLDVLRDNQRRFERDNWDDNCFDICTFWIIIMYIILFGKLPA